MEYKYTLKFTYINECLNEWIAVPLYSATNMHGNKANYFYGIFMALILQTIIYYKRTILV